MQIRKLVMCIVVCELAGAIGSLATARAIPAWYETLVKPSFNPPGWIFGPVWICLYGLMGVAAFLVWRQGLTDRRVRAAMTAFVIQLAINAAWSPLFFGLRSPIAGMIDIVLLWGSIAATIVLFARVSVPAAWLLAPYILWVSFAAILNAAIVRLN